MTTETTAQDELVDEEVVDEQAAQELSDAGEATDDEATDRSMTSRAAIDDDEPMTTERLIEEGEIAGDHPSSARRLTSTVMTSMSTEIARSSASTAVTTGASLSDARVRCSTPCRN